MEMNRNGKKNITMEGGGIIHSNNDGREMCVRKRNLVVYRWEYFLMAMDMYGFATGWLGLRRLNIRMGEVESERASLCALTEHAWHFVFGR